MRRLVVCLSLLLLSLHALAQGSSITEIRVLRLQGELPAALSLATSRLETADAPTAFKLHLELARIHDRIGLHNSTRPVAAALAHIEAADELAPMLGKRAKADVDLAYAEYFYRAEMSERLFSKATLHAEAALTAFRSFGEFHGQADAVHRQGLIKLQQGDLDSAHVLFEESLRLDRIAGERSLLRADYERHVGFVFVFQDDYETALPYFERSLQFRRNAGAIDKSMFAAISVASALVELGRAEEALPYMEEAAEIAEQIDSDIGRARLQSIRGEISD